MRPCDLTGAVLQTDDLLLSKRPNCGEPRRQTDVEIGLPPHPSGERPSGVFGFLGSRDMSRTRHPATCAVTAEVITLPVGKVIRACNGFRYHRIRETIVDGRDRQCGEPPISLCLSARGLGSTDPTIASLRRSKAFPSLVGLGLSTVPAFGRSVPGVLPTAWVEGPTGVPVHRGFRKYPPHGRSRRIASTLGCPGIYDERGRSESRERGGRAMRRRNVYKDS
jgi:hypothetical protein